ncbi:hypothetical protein B0H65DRAFT_433093 [Neurospora tetraspora]|uniref:Uncharacterized protein n=1 Tax=Neurospora tetraspora TaxID=94610 RepID=A0AAE0MNT8_9PEZI|nr:hypothetical protein B0H65DRAFT_433093 [Neurospora tetraspora]
MALADRVNLGPLTTVFTAPAACSTAIFADNKLGWRGQLCVDDGQSITDNTDCWPGTQRGFYSPGLFCPEGYTSACTASAVDGVTSTGWKAQYPLQDGETAIGCCPTGFRCGDLGSEGQTCVLRWGTLSMEQPTAKCINGQLTDFGTMTFPSQKPNLYAGMVQINWKASDRDESATTTTTSANSDSTSGSASASRSNPDLGTDKPAMGKGTVAGTVVGVMMFVLFFPIGWLFRRNRQKKASAEASAEGGHDSDSAADPTRSLVGMAAASRAPGSSAAQTPQPGYADHPMHEAPGDYKPYTVGVYSVSQLDDNKVTPELPMHHEIHEVYAPGANTIPELPEHSEVHGVHVLGAHTTPELPTQRSAYEVAGTAPKGPIHHSVNDAPWSPVDPFEVSATPVDPNRPGSGAAGGR